MVTNNYWNGVGQTPFVKTYIWEGGNIYPHEGYNCPGFLRGAQFEFSGSSVQSVQFSSVSQMTTALPRKSDTSMSQTSGVPAPLSRSEACDQLRNVLSAASAGHRVQRGARRELTSSMSSVELI